MQQAHLSRDLSYYMLKKINRRPEGGKHHSMSTPKYTTGRKYVVALLLLLLLLQSVHRVFAQAKSCAILSHTLPPSRFYCQLTELVCSGVVERELGEAVPPRFSTEGTRLGL